MIWVLCWGQRRGGDDLFDRAFVDCLYGETRQHRLKTFEVQQQRAALLLFHTERKRSVISEHDNEIPPFQ